MATVTNAKNETTTYTYNSLNQLTSVTRPVTGATTTFTYDGHGRIRTTTDSDNYTLTMDYDAFDRPTETNYPDGTTEKTEYRFLDVSSRRDRSGRWTTYTHDAMRRETSMRDPLGRVIQKSWCTCGSLNALIDAKGKQTVWERDVRGRVTKETRPNGNVTTYVYEATNSRLKKITDSKLQNIKYSYFIDGQPKQVTYTNTQVSTPSVSYTYDPAYSRIATMTDGVGTTVYGYYPVSNPATSGAARLATLDGPLPDDTITYTYDQLGRVTSRALNGAAVTVTFDPLGRAITEQTVVGTFMYEYNDGTRRVASVTYPNGQTTSYEYQDAAGGHRLQTIHHKYADGETLSRFDYTYDGVGNILSWRQQRHSDAIVWNYVYDVGNQLISGTKMSTDATPTVLGRHSYAYDSAGNRIVEQNEDSVTGFVYNDVNELVTRQAHGLLRVDGIVSEASAVTINGKPAETLPSNRFQGAASIGSGTTQFNVSATDASGNSASRTFEVDAGSAANNFTYDDNGNLITDGVRTFEWDANNQLVAVSTATHRTEFTYDGRQRRVRVVDTEGGVLQSDIRLVWCEDRICEQRASDGITVTRRIFWRAEESQGQTRFFARDHLGTVTDVTGATGELLSRHAFDPWGRRTALLGDDPIIGFTGAEWQISGGLWLTQYRAYDPDLARWLSVDPLERIRAVHGLPTPDGPNLYQYVRNQPTKYADPTGLTPAVVALPWVLPAITEGACVVAQGVAALGLGVLVGMLTSKPCNDCEDQKTKCARVARECHEECLEDFGDRGTIDVQDYWRCKTNCMNARGCGNFGKYW